MRRDADLEPGILRPRVSARHFDYRAHPTPEPLRPFVANFWTVTWDLTAPYVAQVLPSPCVNVSVTGTEAEVTGITRTRYDRRLVGRGYVVGARFRPACFRPFLRTRVSDLTDTHRPIAEVLDRDPATVTTLAAEVAATEDIIERVRLLADFLATDLPPVDPVAARLAQLVEEIMRRPEVVRVSQVAESAGLGTRHLQRLFGDYVGASPKWVIDRRRLQAAAARGAHAPDPDWSAVAAELGFADQAHLGRAFTAVIGRPPAAFSREAAG